jgi:predicted peroxiredoxin
MAQLLISTSTGPADPTRASIAFHIAANGSGTAGVTCAIALAGDATEIAKPEVAAGVRGVGIPPLADLLEKCRAAAIPIHV